MPKLSPEKPLVVTQKLRRRGYKGPFGGGRHVFMRHPETRIKISVPIHGGRDHQAGRSFRGGVVDLVDQQFVSDF